MDDDIDDGDTGVIKELVGEYEQCWVLVSSISRIGRADHFHFQCESTNARLKNIARSFHFVIWSSVLSLQCGLACLQSYCNVPQPFACLGTNVRFYTGSNKRYNPFGGRVMVKVWFHDMHFDGKGVLKTAPMKVEIWQDDNLLAIRKSVFVLMKQEKYDAIRRQQMRTLPAAHKAEIAYCSPHSVEVCRMELVSIGNVQHHEDHRVTALGRIQPENRFLYDHDHITAMSVQDICVQLLTVVGKHHFGTDVELVIEANDNRYKRFLEDMATDLRAKVVLKSSDGNAVVATGEVCVHFIQHEQLCTECIIQCRWIHKDRSLNIKQRSKL